MAGSGGGVTRARKAARPRGGAGQDDAARASYPRICPCRLALHRPARRHAGPQATARRRAEEGADRAHAAPLPPRVHARVPVGDVRHYRSESANAVAVTPTRTAAAAGFHFYLGTDDGDRRRTKRTQRPQHDPVARRVTDRTGARRPPLRRTATRGAVLGRDPS